MQIDDLNITYYHFNIFADYFQINVEDCAGALPREIDSLETSARVDEEIKTLLNPEAFARHLGVGKGMVCVLTARNMVVPVQVEIRQAPPFNDDHATWDHVVDASIETQSGCIRVWEQQIEGDNEEVVVPLEAGTYRVRIYFGGVYTVSEDRLEGEDHYKLSIWPAPISPTVVLHTSGSGQW